MYQPLSALEYFRLLVGDPGGADIPLFEAAASLAQDACPDLDLQATLAGFDRLARDLAQACRPASTEPARLQRALHFFHVTQGFRGNSREYSDPGNSYLHRVLETRSGIPISLAVLFTELARQVGLEADGVAFPGHFLVKVRLPRGEVVLDPFSGQSLSREELEERLQPWRRRHGLPGETELPLALFLQPAQPRDVLARLLHNLKEIHRSSRDWTRLLGVQDRLVILLPEGWEERRDRGLTLAELGVDEAAAGDLHVYLEHRGDAADAPAVRECLARLRAADGPRLH